MIPLADMAIDESTVCSKSEKITISEEVIRRIMQEDKLIVSNIKRKRYNSYKGEITPAVPNVIERISVRNSPTKNG